MPNQKNNMCENLLHKLQQKKIAYEITKSELEDMIKQNEALFADNKAYQDNLFDLKIKVHMFQKQEIEKTKILEEELAELKKAHQKALQELAAYEAKLKKD